MLWVSFGIMLLAAALIVAWPVYRNQRRFSWISASMVIGVIALSAGIYSRIGTPSTESAESAPVELEEMVRSLDARLQENPDDPEGWKMLGRSYAQLDNPAKAIAAFEKAVALEGSSNAETLISLGEAMLMNDETSIGGRAGELFESGLALAPSNPRGLFYAGLAAANHGDTNLAAERWEKLLAQSPPPQIEGMLRQRIAEWRGIPVSADTGNSVPAPNAAAGLSIDIRVGESAAAAISASSSVFVIARDPAQPSPPLAVVRRRASDLPTVISIDDSNAMVTGRNPSAYDSLEIIVRISASGQPMAQSGDWFGQRIVQTADVSTVAIVVDQQVP